MSKVYQVVHTTKHGFFMLELIGGLVIVALCSSLVVHWCIEIITDNKRLNNQIKCMIEMVSCMNTIKVKRILHGSQATEYGVLNWDAIPFGNGLQGHWIKLRMRAYAKEYLLFFGVS